MEAMKASEPSFNYTGACPSAPSRDVPLYEVSTKLQRAGKKEPVLARDPCCSTGGMLLLLPLHLQPVPLQVRVQRQLEG